MDAVDLLLDEDGDLMELFDDDIEGLSDEQHIQDILVAYPGEYRLDPFSGVNIKRAQNGSINGAVRRDIQINLEYDNYQVGSILYTESQLNINAKRNG